MRDDMTGFPAPQSGGLVLLAKQSAADLPAFNFLNVIQDGFDEYAIEVVSIVPATSVQAFLLEVSTNRGATYETTSYNSNALVVNSTGAPTIGTNAITTAFQMTNSIYVATGWSFNGSYRLYNPLSPSLYKCFTGIGTGPYGSPSRAQWWSSGHWESVVPVNAFRIRMASGNFTSGSVRVYGLAK